MQNDPRGPEIDISLTMNCGVERSCRAGGRHRKWGRNLDLAEKSGFVLSGLGEYFLNTGVHVR
jgi:hypothetical protein